MRPELIAFFDTHPDYRYLIRRNPIWYTRLSRDPHLFQQLKSEVDDFYGRSLSKKIERFGQQLSMVNMMMELAMMAASDSSHVGETKD
ncbi:MAG: YlbE-like family protein [Tuberibacillus sp.]